MVLIFCFDTVEWVWVKIGWCLTPACCGPILAYHNMKRSCQSWWFQDFFCFIATLSRPLNWRKVSSDWLWQDDVIHSPIPCKHHFSSQASPAHSAPHRPTLTDLWLLMNPSPPYQLFIILLPPRNIINTMSRLTLQINQDHNITSSIISIESN